MYIYIYIFNGFHTLRAKPHEYVCIYIYIHTPFVSNVEQIVATISKYANFNNDKSHNVLLFWFCFLTNFGSPRPALMAGQTWLTRSIKVLFFVDFRHFKHVLACMRRLREGLRRPPRSHYAMTNFNFTGSAEAPRRLRGGLRSLQASILSKRGGLRRLREGFAKANVYAKHILFRAAEAPRRLREGLREGPIFFLIISIKMDSGFLKWLIYIYIYIYIHYKI